VIGEENLVTLACGYVGDPDVAASFVDREVEILPRALGEINRA